MKLAGEGQKYGQHVAHFALLLRELEERLGRGLQEWRRRPNRSLAHQLRQGLAVLGDHVRAVLLELSLREHGALVMRLQEREHWPTLARLLKVATLVQPTQLEEAAHGARVGVTRAELVHGLGGPLEQLTQGEREAGRDHVAWNHVQVVVRPRDLQAALANDEDQRRAGVDALVPTRKREMRGRLDHGRSHDRERQTGARRDLLADRLGVRVSIRETPKLRAFHAHFGQTGLDELALDAPHLGVEYRATTWLMALEQVLLRFVQEAALTEGVARTMPRLLDHVQAFGDLAIGIPMRAVELVSTRERKLTRVDLRHMAGLAARDVTGAGVQERHSAQITRQGDQVLYAERVHLQGFVERRIEIDHAGHVDYGVDVATQLFAHLRRHAAKWLHDVTGDDRELAANERREAATVGRA